MDLLYPANVPEVLAALAQRAGRARVLAGGTDLVLRLKAGLESPGALISLVRCAELRGIREDGDDVVLGPMTTHREIAGSFFLRRVAPALGEAAAEVGSPQVRARGTVGGNLLNASPSADLVPPLFVLNATLKLVSAGGERVLPVEELATGPKTTQARPDELLVEVRFVRPSPGEFQRFHKVGFRRALACAKASLAFRARRDGALLRDVRVAFGAVAPTVVRARACEAVLEGAAPSTEVVARAVAAADAGISPIDDVRSSAAYRRAACAELLRRALAATLGSS